MIMQLIECCPINCDQYKIAAISVLKYAAGLLVKLRGDMPELLISMLRSLMIRVQPVLIIISKARE